MIKKDNMEHEQGEKNEIEGNASVVVEENGEIPKDKKNKYKTFLESKITFIEGE